MVDSVSGFSCLWLVVVHQTAPSFCVNFFFFFLYLADEPKFTSK